MKIIAKSRNRSSHIFSAAITVLAPSIAVLLPLGLGLSWSLVSVSNPRDQHRVIQHDPIEDDPGLKHVFEEADSKVKTITDKEQSERMGYCHRIWALKKAVLKNEYGIEWHSPAELNPTVCFD